MTKHWTEFLPEVGRPILHASRDQQDRWEKFTKLSEQFKALSIELNIEENNILTTVMKDWSAEEIEVAKKKAELQ